MSRSSAKPASPPTKTRFVHLLVALAVLGQFVWRADDSLRSESVVWDEQLHAGYGTLMLRQGPSFDGRDHPYAIAALLMAAPTLLDAPGAERGQIERPEVLWPARRTNLALATLGLLLLGVWAWRRHGPLFGLALLAVASFDPAWLSPARYLTTDVGHGLAWWLGAFAFWRHRQRGGLGALLLAGLAVMFGLTTKWSALAMPGMAAVVHALPHGLMGERPGRAGPTLAERARAAIFSGLVAGVLGVLLLAALFVLLGLWHGVAPADALHHVADGLPRAMEMRAAPRGVYLLGDWHPSGTRLYFPALIATKTPVALLVLLAVGLALPAARALWRREAAWLLVPLAWLGIAVLSKQNIGYRHITPALPLFWWLAAAAVVGLGRAMANLRWLGPALILLIAAETSGVHPHYLAFANGLVGGAEEGPEVVVDAAQDWGQALPSLAAWVAAHPPPRGQLDLAYFGNTLPEVWLQPALAGATLVRRPCGVLSRPPSRGTPRAGCGAPADVLAISTTCLFGGAGVKGDDGQPDLTARGDCWARLRAREPDFVIGGAIYVFVGVDGAGRVDGEGGGVPR